METCVWLVVTRCRDEWRYVLTTRGAQCVMMDGVSLKLQWFADNSAYQLNVRNTLKVILILTANTLSLWHCFADAALNGSAAFGEGVGPIYLDDVICFGHEQQLQHCEHMGVGVHNCMHDEDVGVQCPYGNNHNIIMSNNSC